MGKLTRQILKHNISAASRLIRMVEDNLPESEDELKELYPYTGNSHIIGITGLPGAGKSTIIDSLITKFRKQNRTIGVVAIDPSSPYTGGSLLGDRIRLMDHSTDEKVLIKSLATRGWQGGVSKTAISIINIMDAMGKDLVLVETAGVGQTEYDIESIAQTTLVVLVPDIGDYIQILKAGILEIADIFVINKSDKAMDNDLAQNLDVFINLDRASKSEWKPVAVATDALKNTGINNLVESIEKHKKHFYKYEQETYLARKAIQEIKVELKSFFGDLFTKNIEKSESTKKIIESLILKKIYPRFAAMEILKQPDFNKFH
jgi:LAO/AO transport system kinase